MGIFEDIKFGRKAAVIANTLSKKNDDELNNLLYDLRVKYNISDVDFLTINTCISLITSRKVLDRVGASNDKSLGVDS